MKCINYLIFMTKKKLKNEASVPLKHHHHEIKIKSKQNWKEKYLMGNSTRYQEGTDSFYKIFYPLSHQTWSLLYSHGEIDH